MTEAPKCIADFRQWAGKVGNAVSLFIVSVLSDFFHSLLWANGSWRFFFFLSLIVNHLGSFWSLGEFYLFFLFFSPYCLFNRMWAEVSTWLLSDPPYLEKPLDFPFLSSWATSRGSSTDTEDLIPAVVGMWSVENSSLVFWDSERKLKHFVAAPW